MIGRWLKWECMEHCKILSGKPLEECPLERPRKACRYGLGMNIRDERPEIDYLDQNRVE